MILVMLLLMGLMGHKNLCKNGANWKEEEFELYIFFIKPTMKTKYLLVGVKE
jgi:hypothetical protein